MLAMASLLWVKKKNGFTILNPANGKFGLRHYPHLPTAYEYTTTIVDFFQPVFHAICFSCNFRFKRENDCAFYAQSILINMFLLSKYGSKFI